MNIQKDQFSAGEMAEVVGIDGAQLQNWLRRSRLDLPYAISGRRLFSAEFVTRIAMMKDLARYGMGPNQASSLIKGEGRNLDGSLKNWFLNPTGREVRLLSPDADVSESDEPDDTLLFSDTRSSILLPVGAIAKATFESLKSVLAGREGGR